MLAEKFGQLPSDIENLPPDDFARMLAYVNIQRDEEKKAIEKSRRDAKTKAAGRGRGRRR